VVLDRVLGVLGLFLVGTMATLATHDVPNRAALTANTALLWTGSLTGLTVVFLILIPSTTEWDWVKRLSQLPVFGSIVGELIHGLQLYQKKPLAVVGALGLSLFNNSG